MSDISKCKGEGCEIRIRCLRFTAKESEWQSWIYPVNRGENCEFFLPAMVLKKKEAHDRSRS